MLRSLPLFLDIPHFTYNKKRNLITPNMSFDLCRLACSLVEYIVDDFKEFKNLKKYKIRL